MKRRRRTSYSLDWFSLGVFQAMVPGKERTLGFTVTPQGGRWLVIAIEHASNATNVDSLFHDHAHESLGSFLTPAQAFERAEAYANKWLRAESRRLKACACGPIKKKQVSRRS